MSEEIHKRKNDLGYQKLKFKRLNQHQISLIDAALNSIGGFGEVRLVVEKGVLRFIVTQNSIDALNCSSDDFMTMGGENKYER